MSQGIALQFARTEKHGSQDIAAGNMFEQQFIQKLLVAFTPQIKALFNEVLAEEGGQPLIIDYEKPDG